MKYSYLLICALALGTVACGSGGSDDIDFGATAMKALPQVKITTSSLMARNAAVSTGNISTVNTLSKFFKLECYMENSANFCPAGVDYTSGGDQNPYKLTSFTLLGSIHHAKMYGGGLNESCGDKATTVTPSSFVAAAPGGSATKYVLDYFNLLSCGKEETGGVGDGKRFAVYSTDGSRNYQATLTTRYRNPYNGVSTPGQNDIFQVYASGLYEKEVNGEKKLVSKVLAFNYAGADTMYQRTVLILNSETNRFAVKHFENANSNMMAIGIGGVNDAGVLNAGYYFTKYTNGTATEDTGCVDNSTGAFQSSTTPCSTATIPMAWTTSTDVATFLGLTAEDQTRLAAYLAKFNTPALLTADDAPSNATTDPEQNFPKTINL